ncbi:MAG: peptidylprolyl isomerase, partial [Pseudomonadales bacterium]
VRVVKVGKFNVDLDTNHPLAGVNLSFDVEIVEVRDATEEEIAHGHAHGPGGHHH